jgi:hypothetical protein
MIYYEINKTIQKVGSSHNRTDLYSIRSCFPARCFGQVFFVQQRKDNNRYDQNTKATACTRVDIGCDHISAFYRDSVRMACAFAHFRTRRHVCRVVQWSKWTLRCIQSLIFLD